MFGWNQSWPLALALASYLISVCGSFFIGTVLSVLSRFLSQSIQTGLPW